VNVVDATKSYEDWLRVHLSAVLDDDLGLKHERMATDLFDFLRATYYRWLQVIEHQAPKGLAQSPALVAVGDLHVENFGCWRAADGRLAWGVNDFDEPARLPYAFDLLRLCASALVAIRTERLPLHEHEACAGVLEGYRDSLACGGRPFAGDAQRWLAGLAEKKIAAAPAFWKKLRGLPELADPLPREAAVLLQSAEPTGGWEPTLRRRTAGLGSLGHRRAVALGSSDDGPEACELKELAPPAGDWLVPGTGFAQPPDAGPSWAPDPSSRTLGTWRRRRLAPDGVRLELVDYPRGDERRLLHAMGFETANVHQRSAPEDLARVRRHAETLTVGALQEAAESLTAAVEHDWRAWRRHASA
jgi:hypothetical protein